MSSSRTKLRNEASPGYRESDSPDSGDGRAGGLGARRPSITRLRC